MKIDIVHSALMGFKTVYGERHYLLKLVAIPLFVKLISTIAVYISGIDVLSFYYIIAMLPSYFVEGWFIAQFLRTLLTGERWPMRLSNPPTDNEMRFMFVRARGILSCILCFTLIMMLHGGATVALTNLKEIMELNAETPPTSGSFPVLLAGIGLMIFSIWAFRTLWLYIPLVILAPLGAFMRDIKGMMTSVYMMAIWVMTVVPIMFVVMLFSTILLGENSLSSAPSIAAFLTIGVHVIGEILSHTIAVTAIAYAYKGILIKYGAKPIFIEPEKPF